VFRQQLYHNIGLKKGYAYRYTHEDRKNIFQENVLQKLFDYEQTPIASQDLKKSLDRLKEMGLIEEV